MGSLVAIGALIFDGRPRRVSLFPFKSSFEGSIGVYKGSVKGSLEGLCSLFLVCALLSLYRFFPASSRDPRRMQAE